MLDRIEPDDGMRMWVEPIGLTKDLQQWCRVDHVRVVRNIFCPRLVCTTDAAMGTECSCFAASVFLSVAH